MEHKLITGGEQWLPFARSRIRALKATGLKYASQQFMIDGASVKVRIAGDQEYIELSGVESGYQFFSSGPAVSAVPYAEFRLYQGYAAATARQGKQSRALASSIEAGIGAAPVWPLVEALAITKRFPVKNIWQLSGITEHAFYGRKSGTEKLATTPLVDSWSSAGQLTGLPQRGGNRRHERLSSAYDITYDVPPTLNSKWRAPDADWYKRAAIRTVEHPEYGTRRFIILSDITNNFYVYPVGADDNAVPDARYLAQSIKTNIAAVFVRTFKAPLPGWCRQSSEAARDIRLAGELFALDYVTQVPQYRWAFNSTATRACAVVFEDLEVFAGPAGLPEPPFFLDGKGKKYAIQESLPGLVEIDISITLTGKGNAQFDAAATVSQLMQPTSTGKYIMGADYAWPMPGQAAIDDLILMTGSVYHASTERAVAAKSVNLFNHVSKIEVENAASGALLRSFLTHRTTQVYMGEAGGGFDVYPDTLRQEAGAILMAVDLRVLGFTVRQKYTERALTWTSPTTGSVALDGRVSVRIQTFMRNELADEIVMEPEGSATHTALVNFFADDSVAGMFKMPITERGGVSTAITAGTPNGYWGLGITEPGSPYANYIDTGTGAGLPVDMGAFLYAKLMASTLGLTAHSLFAIHPDGHWSLTTSPVTYHPGPVAIDQDGVGIAGLFDAAAMRSARVDIVSFRAKPTAMEEAAGKLGAETRMTHLALLNKAFGKTWTAADFLPQWRKVQVDTPLSRITLLADSVSDRSFELQRQYRTEESGAWIYESVARPRTFDLQTGPLQVAGSYTGVPLADLFDRTAVLGGSALFL